MLRSPLDDLFCGMDDMFSRIRDDRTFGTQETKEETLLSGQICQE